MSQPITRKVKTVVDVARAFALHGRVVVEIKQTDHLTPAESKKLRRQLKHAELVARSQSTPRVGHPQDRDLF